ncbi:MAG: FtsB family cell division protein [Flavobacteriales bacterium]
MKKIVNKKWVKTISNKYFIVFLLFIIWMFFFDTNSFFIHQELNNDIEELEENKAFYKNEIQKDKKFIEKMKDTNEQEKFARETYYLKKENEEIYLIENKTTSNKEKK